MKQIHVAKAVMLTFLVCTLTVVEKVTIRYYTKSLVL